MIHQDRSAIRSNLELLPLGTATRTTAFQRLLCCDVKSGWIRSDWSNQRCCSLTTGTLREAKYDAVVFLGYRLI